MSLSVSIPHWLALLISLILALLLWRLLKFYETSEFKIHWGWQNDLLILLLAWTALALGIFSAILLINLMLTEK